MGQRMPPVPHIYGDDCLSCFPAGKTPKYVYVRFSGLVTCVPPLDPPCVAPPNDRVFKLTQFPGVPCHFQYNGPDWFVRYDFAAGWPLFSCVDLKDDLFRLHFLSNDPPCLPEGEVVHNTVVCGPIGACSVDGMAVVTWTQQATELLESLNIQRADDLFMEMRPLVDGNLIYKFCKLKDGTNIQIEFEPD